MLVLKKLYFTPALTLRPLPVRKASILVLARAEYRRILARTTEAYCAARPQKENVDLFFARLETHLHYLCERSALKIVLHDENVGYSSDREQMINDCLRSSERRLDLLRKNQNGFFVRKRFR